MSLPTAEEVTNKYLYGSINRPSDLLDQSIIDHKNSNTPNEIKINAVEYMASGPGKFVNAANFDLVKQFFDLSNSIQPGKYSKTDVLKMFGYLDPVTGNAIQGMYAGYAVNQIYLGTNEPDYAERAYIWGTTGFKINDDPIFVVDSSGNREVRNFYIEPAGDEDFDFEGGPASKRGNEALEPVIDPSGIGRTVGFKFEDKNKIPTSTLTMSSFVNDVDNCIDVDVIDKTLTAIPAVYAIEELENKLFNTGDQSTRFLDDDDRPIIYGTNDDDVIDGTVTLHKTTAYKTPIDLYVKEYKLGGLGVISTLGLDSNLYPYLKNGITYIAGRGDDFVNGTMKSDAIYGGQGSDTLDGKIGADKMYGGTEDDTYIVDDENDEVIEYENEGDDRVESSITYSLTENVESLILTETDHIDGTGNSLDNYIFGNDGNNTLNGEAGNDDILGYLGDDTLYGGDNDDYLTGGEGDDVLYGGSDNDVLYGEGDNDELYGEGGRDHLEGGEGDDLLDGGAGNDVLRGGSGQDTLKGGAGFDTYYVDAQEIVNDSDGKGQVLFNNRLLTGGSRTEDDPEDTYYGGGNTYVLNGSTLTVNGSLEIQNYSKEQASLRIVLTEEEGEEDETPDVDDAENRTSPIVIDLDGDGIETLEVGSSYFDLDADGLSEMTGWVSPDDGLLVHDRDGNGRISNGTELFGNYSTLDNGDTAENGFQALAEYDDNGDGIVDAQDASYENLQIWRDLNGNGVSDSGEFQRLADAGVVSISTEYAASDYVDDNGHAHRQVSTVMLSDGIASTVADVWFKIDSARRMNSGDVELTPEVVSLANAKGFGKVQDLWQAMVHDTELVSLLNQYVEATDPATRDTLLDDLIYRWAGADSVDPYSRDPSKVYGHVMDARQLVTLENLVGHSYLGTWCWGERDPNPHGQAAPLLIAEYLEFKRFTAAQILAQTEYAEELDIIKSAFGSDAHGIEVDWDQLHGTLSTLLSEGYPDRVEGIIAVLTDLGTYSPDYRGQRDNAFQFITSSDPDLAPFFDFSTRIGSEDDDILYGSNDGSVFYGMSGDDRLYGLAGNDSYFFTAGQGADTILDRGGLDQIVFGEGVTQERLSFSRNTTTVWITVRDENGVEAGSLRIDNFFDFDGTVDFGAIETIRFADGTSLNEPQILTLLTESSITGNDDLIFGTAAGDSIDALGGDDKVHGLAGDDWLSGGIGDDVLMGDDGDDHLSGDDGNDRLIGGRGSDTYLFDMGHGKDVIDNAAGDSESKIDVIEFGAGIEVGSVAVNRVNMDLLLQTSSVDSIRIVDYFSGEAGDGTAIDEIHFQDGSVWGINDVKAMVLQASADDDVIEGYASNDILSGLGGDDQISGHGGNDELDGGEGQDTLRGGDGNDLISGGEGKDTLYGGEGDDVLDGGEGDDRLIAEGGNDTLTGGEGSDYLEGGSGQDSLYGGAGNDRLIGGAGDDFLQGGLGDDTLDGGSGTNKYRFARGDGQDFIHDSYENVVTIYLSDLPLDNLVFRRNGVDLEVTFPDSPDDKVSLSSLFKDEVAISGIRVRNTAGLERLIDASQLYLLTLAGTEADDVIRAYSGDDVIETGNGNDWVSAFGGRDIVSGGDGNDVLYGGSGDDRLFGGANNDLIEGEDGHDQLSGGTGADTINGGSGNDTFLFSRGDGADVIIDASGEDTIELTDIASTELRVRRVGDDLLLFIPGSDDFLTIQNQYDGSGSAAVASSIEEVRFSDGVAWNFADLMAQAVVGSDEDDKINGFDTGEVIDALDGADIVYAEAGADTVSGGAGNDILYGGNGADQLNGNSGDDQLYGEQGEDLLSGGDGADLLQGGSDNDQLFGGAGNDELYGDDGDDALSGGGDDDTLYGGSGNDQLYGDDGNDLLYAEGGSENMLSGGDGDDQLYGVGQLFGDAGNDYLEGQGVLSGGEGNDELHGQGSDTLLGGGGNDILVAYSDPWALTSNTLAGGAGVDTLYGSYGDDTYQFDLGDGQDTLIETHIDGAFSNIDPSTDTLVFGAGIVAADLSFIRHGDDLSIEHSNGTDSILVKKWFAEPTDHFKINRFLFDDGSELSDLEIEEASVTQGTTSDDTLLGYRDLNEEIHAGDGNDQVWGRTGDDLIYGEAGDDYLDGEEGNDYLIGGEGADNLVGRAGDDTLEGDAGEDSLQGGEGADHLHGGADDDSLFGGSGDDLLDGGSGADYFDAGAGNDTLLGGDGNDQLSGGIGDDQMTGGAGDDKYVYFGGDGHDVIDTSDGGNDGVFFGSGISEDRLHFTRAGDDLLILIDDGSDGSVRVLNHFQSGERAIDWVQPDGGYMISTTQINQRVAAGETSGDYDSVISGTDSGEQLAGSSGSDLIQGLAGDDTLFGMTGDDRIEGGNGSDQLYGGNGSGSGSGNDQLIGGAGNDILAGEDGNDELQGGEGDDRYYYSAGQGVDTIDNTGGGSDGIFFLDGLDRGRLSYHRDGNDLVILIDADLEQQVRINNHFLGGEYAISYVQPTDGGYSIMASEIASMLTDLPTVEAPDDGESGEEGGTSEPGNDTGGETGTGEDPVAELGGDDIINGTVSNDILVGGVGNDTLIGNGGDDRLLGGEGDDTYIFTSGEVILTEYSGTDTLTFSAGITFSQVASGLMKSGNDLILQVAGGASGQVTLKDYFIDGDAIVETIEFESGGSLTSDQIFGAFGLSVPGVSAGYDQLTEGTVGDDSALNGTSGSDLISGFNGSDRLAGGEGDDLLSGGNGDDILSGNAGADTLLGGRGNDTYLFYSGDGEDTIDNTGGGIDVLRFEDIDFGQVSSGLMRSGDDLILRVSGSSDAVTLKSFFLGGDAAIDRVEFASGGEITSDQFFSVFGLNNPDSVGSPDYQGVPDERNFGTYVSGTADGDTIIASSGADLIDGGAGDDWLQGNQGNDYLMGGEGSDTYYYSTGDGQDSINNQSSGGDADTLQFADGIDESDLWFSRDGNDLLADFRNSSDQVRVQGWYSGSTQQLDSIQTDDAVISATQIEQLVSAMAAFGAPVDGEIVLTAAEEQQVQETIANTWQVRT